MNQLYYLAIPIILGTISVFFLFGMENDEGVLFSKKNLMENGSPLLGELSAQITILEWGDYQCTFCYRFHQSSLNIILEEYIDSGKINFVFKDFPLNGADSILGAEATYCAGDQGKY